MPGNTTERITNLCARLRSYRRFASLNTTGSEAPYRMVWGKAL